MKERKIKKRIASVLKIYLLYAVLTAILVPLPQKEASGALWQQYEARLDTAAAQERVMTVEDSDSALLLRLQLIESAEKEIIFSTFDLRADGSGQDLMAALYGAAQRGAVHAVIAGAQTRRERAGRVEKRADACQRPLTSRTAEHVAPGVREDPRLVAARFGRDDIAENRKLTAASDVLRHLLKQDAEARPVSLKAGKLFTVQIRRYKQDFHHRITFQILRKWDCSAATGQVLPHTRGIAQCKCSRRRR